jgi:hypothetical protein
MVSTKLLGQGEGPFGLGPVGEEGLGCQPRWPAPHFLEGGRPLDVTVFLHWALFVLRAHGVPLGEWLGAQFSFCELVPGNEVNGSWGCFVWWW